MAASFFHADGTAISNQPPSAAGGAGSATASPSLASRLFGGISRVFQSASKKEANRLAEDDKKQRQFKINRAADQADRAAAAHTMALERKVLQVLLLGTCMSGKSTVYKQAITHFGRGYSDEDRKSYLSTLHGNIIFTMKQLLTQSNRLGHRIAATNRAAATRITDDWLNEEHVLDAAAVADIDALWNDQGIQATYAVRHEFQLPDNIASFLPRVAQMIEPGYIPSMDDILRCRWRTTGIVETSFTMNGIPILMNDLGGARNERKKWVHVFERAAMVIFIAAISEYDQTLFEDDRSNRLTEAITLFGEICNSPWFEPTSITLWLTKRDQFAAKLDTSPLSTLFPDYQGGNDYGAAQQYITNQFLAQNRNPARVIHVEVIDATSPSETRAAFDHCDEVLRPRFIRLGGVVPTASAATPPVRPSPATSIPTVTAAASVSSPATPSSSSSPAVPVATAAGATTPAGAPAAFTAVVASPAVP